MHGRPEEIPLKCFKSDPRIWFPNERTRTQRRISPCHLEVFGDVVHVFGFELRPHGTELLGLRLLLLHC